MSTVELTADNFDASFRATRSSSSTSGRPGAARAGSSPRSTRRPSEKHPDIVFGKVDTEAEQALAASGADHLDPDADGLPRRHPRLLPARRPAGSRRSSRSSPRSAASTWTTSAPRSRPSRPTTSRPDAARDDARSTDGLRPEHTVARPFDETLAATRAAARRGRASASSPRSTWPPPSRPRSASTSPPQVILGACRPPLAHAALQAEPSIGLLLPCNVVVRAVDDDHTIVEAIDPRAMTGLSGDGALDSVAADARRRLTAVLAALTGEDVARTETARA